MDRSVIKARREAIEADSPCDGCGATLALCKSQRGKDPTAPSWLGCCARGAMLDVPCLHKPEWWKLRDLLKEIEEGKVAPVPTPEDDLLNSITETRSTLAHLRRLVRQVPRDGLSTLHPAAFYAQEEDR